MNTEDYKELVESYLSHIKTYMKDNGGLSPHITVFADNKNPEKDSALNSLIHIPIPSEYMETDGDKDILVDEIFPKIFNEINKKFIPYAIAWASEAWLREADPNFDVTKENWKKLPIRKEVVFITIEDENLCKTQVYEIKRIGKQVNTNGNLVDEVELEMLQDFVNPVKTDGRFSGLYKKLNKHV
jgi:hypothetical protein